MWSIGGNDADRGQREYSEKNLSQGYSILYWTGMNRGLRSDRPATDRLSHGAARNVTNCTV